MATALAAIAIMAFCYSGVGLLQHVAVYLIVCSIVGLRPLSEEISASQYIYEIGIVSYAIFSRGNILYALQFQAD